MSVMERPTQRPRSKSTFSFKSDKSHSSKNHEKHHKESLRESSEEKRRTHLKSESKADPNAAMNENQPIAAALEKPTLQSLRSFNHTDIYGNPIAEPDLSNPTRPRWERPLDTIKSFEAAIDNEYKRRRSVLRADTSPEAMNGYQSRRSSYYGAGNESNRYSQAGGYYGSRAAAAARESTYAESQYGPMGGPPPRSRYSQRLHSDPTLNRYPTPQGQGVYPNPPQGQGVYPNPTPGYQQSRDTVQTERSNGSHSDPWANSTDPSSENSSIERALPVQKPAQNLPNGEDYGFSGFGGGPQFQGPILEEFGNGNDATHRSRNGGNPAANGMHFPQNAANIPPPVPAKTGPIKLGGNYPEQPQPNGGAQPNTLQRQNTDKRKSWFKRRFSKD